jgi:hypothetical protein
MTYLVLIILIAASIGLGFALRKKAPTLHLAMCVLISFLAMLILFVGVAKALGMLGP